jgi:hypothetical protein
MHAALWLYLAILAVVPPDTDVLEVKLQDLATATGLREGTIRSWLGHLRKYRYLAIRSVNGMVRIRVKRHIRSTPPKEPPPKRLFTVPKLERALGETGCRKLLEDALASYPDPVMKRALTKTMAVPVEEIRRSRTALFLYLLRREHP